jgi:ABC-type nitrate/sulfonate/bicarbonate transport system ATPase subunit
MRSTAVGRTAPRSVDADSAHVARRAGLDDHHRTDHLHDDFGETEIDCTPETHRRDNLIPFLTARENVLVALEINGVTGAKAVHIAQQLLDYLGVGERRGF